MIMDKNYVKAFVKEVTRKSVKNGDFLNFLNKCILIVEDYKGVIDLRKTVDYLDNFYSIEIFLETHEEDYILAIAWLKYISSLTENKFNKLKYKSNLNNKRRQKDIKYAS